MLERQSFEPADRRELLATMIAAFERDDMELAVDLLLDRLDELDGDPDLEPNGDELDGSSNEEDFWPAGYFPLRTKEPGCPIGDPDLAVDDDGCDGDDDSEQSLGAPEDGPAGTEWRNGARFEEEDEREEDDPSSDRRLHRDRIRRTRCIVDDERNAWDGSIRRSFWLREPQARERDILRSRRPS